MKMKFRGIKKIKSGKINLVLISSIALILLLAGCTQIKFPPITNPPAENIPIKEIPKFSSCSAIKAAFSEAIENSRNYSYGEYGIAVATSAPQAAEGSAQNTTDYGTDYSKTNVQVEGVDEADIMKSDGKYIYLISNGYLVISEVYPAQNAKVLSETKLDLSPQEIFLHENTLLVFGYPHYEYDKPIPLCEGSQQCVYPSSRNFGSAIQLIDVSNKSSPEVKREIDFEGSYVSSRKIGEFVYFVLRSYPDYRILEAENAAESMQLPAIRDSRTGNELIEPSCAEIGYLPPVQASNFITVGSISMNGFNSEIKKETVVASGENVFASQENLYLAETSYSYEPVIMDSLMPYNSNEKTVIHKFALNDGSVNYIGNGEAKGTILNQFSMDEFNNYFRIATTTGHVARSADQASSSNNVYVFDSEMKQVGKLEDLAPGERIYSARFMGNKGYMVTFKKVDPLFVIDLSIPSEPKVLGKLKIPGYSDYLHPIDETHLIGIGKDTVEAEEGDFAWYQGLKIAVFDVSDVSKPKEMFKEIIGDRGTDSYALQDHKAFLYDKEKELLVLPITLAELTAEQKTQIQEGELSANTYGDFTFQGAYVYKLNLTEGFELKGRITHVSDPDAFLKSGYHYYGNNDSVKRAMYIENMLYTISDKHIKANDLTDLSEKAKLDFLKNLNDNYYSGGYKGI